MSALTSARLTLFPFSSNDLEEVHALNSLPETGRYNTAPTPQHIGETEKTVREWMQTIENGTGLIFTIRENDSDEFVGLIGLKFARPHYRQAEAWYKIHPAHWQKGFATEALRRVLDFCFVELQLHRVDVGCATGNVASARVMEKSGMRKEGHKRKNLPLRGKPDWSDSYIYAMLEEDYFNR